MIMGGRTSRILVADIIVSGGNDGDSDNSLDRALSPVQWDRLASAPREGQTTIVGGEFCYCDDRGNCSCVGNRCAILLKHRPVQPVYTGDGDASAVYRATPASIDGCRSKSRPSCQKHLTENWDGPSRNDKTSETWYSSIPRLQERTCDATSHDNGLAPLSKPI